MNELSFSLLRLGYLVLLWLLAGGSILVLSRDIYGTVVTRRDQAKSVRPAKGRKQRKRDAAVSTLLVTEGPLTGSSLQLTDRPVIVGRAPTSTLVLDDDYASAQHARIFPRDGQWFVEDLGSTNGTVVGGVRITSPTPLSAHTPVRFGQTIVELR